MNGKKFFSLLYCASIKKESSSSNTRSLVILYFQVSIFGQVFSHFHIHISVAIYGRIKSPSSSPPTPKKPPLTGRRDEPERFCVCAGAVTFEVSALVSSTLFVLSLKHPQSLYLSDKNICPPPPRPRKRQKPVMAGDSLPVRVRNPR